MKPARQNYRLVQAEAESRFGKFQHMRFEMPIAPDHINQWQSYRVDLSVTPRPLSARARYCDYWEPHRFERMGELYVVPPNASLHFKAMEPLIHEALVCELDPDTVHSWLGDPIEWTQARLEASLDIPNGAMRQILRRLGQEAHRPGPGHAQMVEFLMGQLGIEFGRHITNIENPGPAPGGLSPWRLQLIDDRLRELRAPPSLETLASLCGMSVRQLTRSFRASRGCTIGEYIAQSRVDRAKFLLGRGESSGSTSRLLGFASQASFTTTFRRATGITPRQFQQHLHRIGTAK